MVASLAQNEHWKSEKTTIVTSALRLPRTGSSALIGTAASSSVTASVAATGEDATPFSPPTWRSSGPFAGVGPTQDTSSATNATSTTRMRASDKASETQRMGAPRNNVYCGDSYSRCGAPSAAKASVNGKRRGRSD